MILKDDAIALRMYPFGNTSNIAVWLSRTYGKLATLAKGSHRVRSAFLGQSDLFYTCEILFYAREQRNLHTLKECAPLASRNSFRTNWRACAAASYTANLLDRVLPFGPAPHGLYELLTTTLDHLASHTPGPAFLVRFELLLLHELGFAPDWNACSKCHADLLGNAPARMDAAHGALRCETCAPPTDTPITPAARNAIRTMLGPVLPASLPESIFREIRTLAGGLLEHHADLAPRARDLAFQIVAT